MMITKTRNVMLFEEFHAQKALNEGKKKESEKDEKGEKEEGELTEDEESDLLDIEDLIDAKKFTIASKMLDKMKKANVDICKNTEFKKLVKASSVKK